VLFNKARDDLSDKQLQTIKQKMDRLWKINVFTSQKEVSKGDFVSMMKQRYESNTTAFIEMVRAFSSNWSEVIDLNGDKCVSEDEFISNFVAQTHNHIQNDKKFFYRLQPSNGRVANDNIIEYFVHFATEPEKSKPDVILNAINSGI
jgi:hypothetical protein